MRWKVVIVAVVGFFAIQWVVKTRAVKHPPTPRVEAVWLTDAAAALAQAKAENRVLLMDFTGSDWCGWCIKLDDEVFATEQFANYARNKLVLLKVDFPRGKKQSSAEIQQNERLAHQYGVTGFPTIVVLSPDGKEKGRLGYRPGGPGPWLAAVDGMR